MCVFPKSGISIADTITLKYETLDPFFDSFYASDLMDADSLIKLVGIDSNVFRESVGKSVKLRSERVLEIQHSDPDRSSLSAFYDSLTRLKSDGGKVRVLYYGDSQIECDRMTNYIRNEFQKEYGGSGPGLELAYQVIPTGAVRQTKSVNWKRYAAYGRKSRSVKHNNYGLLASFSRYKSLKKSSKKSKILSAWLEIKPASYGYKRLRKFSQMSLWLGGNKEDVEIKISANSKTVFTDELKAETFNRKINVNFPSTPRRIKISFKGLDSPDVYGLSFESEEGIIVDNIPLRGCSGTIFSGINKTLLERQFAHEPVKLVILQFGGNILPHIDTEAEAKRYGEAIRENLKYFKSILPESSLLVVGPSDMATKIKGKFVTYPFLENIRDHMQRAANAEGAAYYDMFEVMGGKNSILKWIKAKPRLARRDYVHFTTKGAKKMAMSLYQALRKDNEKYINTRTDKSNAVSVKK